MWDFDKLSDEEKAQARVWTEQGNWSDLNKLQNKHRLSGKILCCNLPKVRAWFQYAYENNLI